MEMFFKFIPPTFILFLSLGFLGYFLWLVKDYYITLYKSDKELFKWKLAYTIAFVSLGVVGILCLYLGFILYLMERAGW